MLDVPRSVVGLVVLGPERDEVELGQRERERRLEAVGGRTGRRARGREPTCPGTGRRRVLGHRLHVEGTAVGPDP
jgi:hypothetical protein